jgi:hypothetical protein
MCKYFSTTSSAFLLPSFLTENYLRAYIARFTFFVISISDWSHLHSSSFPSCSFLCLQSFPRRLHHVNWLALLFPSKNAFWRVSLDDNDVEKERGVRRNITSPDLYQQYNETTTYIHIYTFNLIIFHIANSLFHI